MFQDVTGNGATKSGLWVQRVLLFTGVPLVLLAAILAIRIIWEETSLTLQDGPQMIGFSLAHGTYAFLLVVPLLLVVWVLAAFLTMVVFLWRRRRLSRWLWSGTAALVVILGAIVVPPVFWQWLFIGTFAKSPHAADLMTYAAAEGNTSTVRGYLAHGVPLEGTNYEGSTAAFTAAAGGSVSVLELLASKGANLSSVNAYGDSPLEAAVENHHDGAVALLRSKGARQIKGTPEQRDAASHSIVEKEIERLRQH